MGAVVLYFFSFFFCVVLFVFSAFCLLCPAPCTLLSCSRGVPVIVFLFHWAARLECAHPLLISCCSKSIFSHR